MNAPRVSSHKHRYARVRTTSEVSAWGETRPVRSGTNLAHVGVDWTASPALQVAHPRPNAEVTLACLPYAGGTAAAFRDWGMTLDQAEVVAVQLPGHGTRIHETPLRSVALMALEAATALAAVPARQLVLFGHSMGAMVSFETARLLELRDGRRVAALIVSGCRAPQVRGAAPTYNLSRDAFERQLRELGGTPEAVLDSPELMDLFAPMLRADIEAAETYRDVSRSTIDAPITAICGARDPIVSPQAMEGWRERTTSGLPFRVEMLPGGHFFLQTDQLTTLAHIRQRLDRSVDGQV